ncbi:MAG TPA: hypothetical protein VG816_02375 [Solirubrobacterales bacterium]|nr:hypothetical protein [Solirubrobacterales bacterium]
MPVALAILLSLHVGLASASEKGVVAFFGGNGSEGGQFGPARGIAVNQDGAGGVTAGDVYVVDSGNYRIQEFTAAGVFVRAFGLDVGGPGVDVCTVAASCQEATASEAAGSLFAPGSIAIDQATGTVYVTGRVQGAGRQSNYRVDVFSATGEFEGAFGWNVKVTGGAEALQFCTTESGCKAGSAGSGAGQFNVFGESNDQLAVSPLNGHLIVGDEGNGRIDEFAPSFEEGKVDGVSFIRSYGDAAGFGNVGVNGAGEVFWRNAAKIEAYSPTGTPEGSVVEFDSPESPGGLAVNAANGNFILGYGLDIEIYGPSGELLEAVLKGARESVFIHGVAQNEQSETIYLSTDYPENGVLVLGEPVPPTASVEPVTTFTGTTATFKGHVNPKGFLTKYHFEYSSDGQHWTKLPEEELPGDSEEHAVSQQATGLEAHTTYQLRLVAEKLFHAGSASAETSFETSAAAPLISAAGADQITDTTVRLTGTINPENEATSYHFECVTRAQFEASGYTEAREVPSGGASLEASGEKVKVTQPFTGLSPATEYRCRLAASNPTGDAAALEASFATFASQPLGPPDGRVYEQATPVDKNGGDARGGAAGLQLQAAPDGSAVTYLINSGVSVEGGGQHFPLYSAMRTGGAWTSHSFLPSSTYGNRTNMLGWSEDARRDYVIASGLGEPTTLYEQNLESGAMTPIAGGLASAEHTAFAGESAGGTVALLESQEVLATGATAGWNNLYLWNRSTHKLSLVDVGPGGTPPVHGAFAGAYYWQGLPPESKRGGPATGLTQQQHVLSTDGSTAFFTSYNVAQLYARKGLDTAHPETVQVSATQKTNGSGVAGKDPHGPQKAAFMDATPDGHYVFFTSPEELTNNATTGTKDEGNDLYRYDTQSGELIDIAPDGTDPHGAEVQGVLGASADGSYVYFAANGVLDEGATAGDCTPFDGTCNIYLWHEGAIEFVASKNELGDLNRDWSPGSKSSRVSASGTLLFAGSSLTSYDSEGKEELYRFEPGTGLGCVSCNPIGATPVGSAHMQDSSPGFTSTAGRAPVQSRNVSANGRRVFFETPDQLVASDVNGQDGCPLAKGARTPNLSCQDVYEWEAKGEGSCESEAQNGGCIYLISTGESDEPSYFVGASESGDDAFFFTRQQLVRQDTDQLQDVYDARIGGGIASQNEAPPPKCEGEACKGAAPAVSGAQSAGSAGFSGPSNPKPAHAKRKKRHTKHNKKHSQKGKKKHASKGRAGR